MTENLVPMIENSLKYYQKCVARFAALNNVLIAPSKVHKGITYLDVGKIARKLFHSYCFDIFYK